MLICCSLLGLGISGLGSPDTVHLKQGESFFISEGKGGCEDWGTVGSQNVSVSV